MQRYLLLLAVVTIFKSSNCFVPAAHILSSQFPNNYRLSSLNKAIDNSKKIRLTPTVSPALQGLCEGDSSLLQITTDVHMHQLQVRGQMQGI